jgi:hypothetical protein
VVWKSPELARSGVRYIARVGIQCCGKEREANIDLGISLCIRGFTRVVDEGKGVA